LDNLDAKTHEALRKLYVNEILPLIRGAY